MYNAYNIPISRVSLLFETNDFGYLSKIWIPKIYLIFKYRKFIKKYNEWFNNADEKKDLVNEWTLLRLRNKARNLFPFLYYSLVYSPNNELRDIFTEHFGKFPEKEDDLQLIIDRINKLNDQLAVLETPRDNNNQSLTFAQTVALVEGSRNIPISRNISLFEFYGLYKTETEKWQQNK